MLHRLTYNAGAQTVRTVPLDQDGRPVKVASATYAVVDTRYDADDSGHELATGAATVDAVSTTLAAAAGRSTEDPHLLVVASAVGIAAGRRYLLTYRGQPELVKILGIDGTTLRLAAQVTLSFPTGASFQGVEISCSVPSTVTEDDAYLDDHVLAVRWTPLGLAPWLESIYLERAKPTQLISPDEVLSLDPTLEAFLDADMTGDQAVRLAVDDFHVDLLAAGREDGSVLAGPVGKRAVMYLAAWHILKGSTDTSAVSRAERYHARYAELRNNLLQGMDKAKVRNLTPDLAAKGPEVQSRFRPSW